MKVIFLSIDQNADRVGTATYTRMTEYKKLFDEVRIIVVTGVVSLIHSFFVSRHIIKEDPRAWTVSSQEEFTGLVGFLLKFLYGASWQAQIHTDIFSPHYKKIFFKNRIRAIIARVTLPHASCVRAVSERVKESLYNNGITVPIFLLPIYTDISFARDIVRTNEDAQFRVVMISRLTREKNISLALRACTNFPKVTLTIVGDGPEKKNIQQEVESLCIKKRVRFMGWQKDIAPYLADADCFLVTSWYEGYGLSVIEAMAAGLPVVMSNVGIAGELLKDGISGRVFEPGNQKQLCQILKELESGADMRRRFGLAAREAVAALPSKVEYLTKFKQSFELCKS